MKSAQSGNLTSLALIALLKAAQSINPSTIAMSVLAVSLLAASLMFKASLTSWASFVLILTFSSGMMTLFIYASSMSPNEKTKTSKMLTLLLPLLMISPILPNPSTKSSKTSMATFSNQQTMMIMTLMLILTMVTIASQSFNPNQSVSSTF